MCSRSATGFIQPLFKGPLTPSEDMPFVVYPLFKGVALQLVPCPAPRRHFLALVGLFVV